MGSSISEQRPQKQSRSQDAGLVLLKRKTDFSNRKSYPGTEKTLWSISEFPVPRGIQAEAGHHPFPPARLLREFLHWDGVGRLLWPNEAAPQPQEPQLTPSLTEHISTKACSVPGWGQRAPEVGGAEPEEPPLSTFPAPIWSRGW